jgi:hypothetical protein
MALTPQGQATHKFVFADWNGIPYSSRPSHKISICLYVEFVTPDYHDTSALRLLYYDPTQSQLVQVFFAGRQRFNTIEPWAVIQETGSVLWKKRTRTSVKVLEDSPK